MRPPTRPAMRPTGYAPGPTKEAQSESSMPCRLSRVNPRGPKDAKVLIGIVPTTLISSSLTASSSAAACAARYRRTLLLPSHSSNVESRVSGAANDGAST